MSACGRARPAQYSSRVRLDDQTIPEWLREAGVVGDADEVQVVAAGDGNINFVRHIRVESSGGSREMVLKQARPELERFPQYEVTTERIVFEHRYGEVVRARAPDVAGVLPEVIHFDSSARVLVMEDLGSGPRLDEELAAGRVPFAALHELGHFLGSVHKNTRVRAESLARSFANDEMRNLHGEHIFTLPYQPNDFPISDELRAIADKELGREGVREAIGRLRDRYYRTVRGLVHGDPQAGNVLLQGDSARLLDAEIAHVGDPAFDLGTAMAHVGVSLPTAPDPAPYMRGLGALVEGYLEGGGSSEDLPAARGYSGVEILRRSIGAARLERLARDEDAAAAMGHGIALLLS